MRAIDRESREKRESDDRLRSVRVFVAKLQTEAERLTIIDEMLCACGAEGDGATAAHSAPANDLGVAEGGWVVDPAGVGRLKQVVLASEDRARTGLAAADIRVRKPVANHTRQRIAVEAVCDERTLDRYLAGLPVRATSAFRIERAAAALGLTLFVAQGKAR